MIRRNPQLDAESEHTAFAKTRVLVGLAQDGDNTALNNLLARYFPRVLRVVRLKRGPFLAQRLEDHDMVQEILIRVWKSLDQYDAQESASFLLWVTKIAENALRDLARRQRARKRNPDRGSLLSLESEDAHEESHRHPISMTTPSRIVGSFESSRLVDTAVGALDEETQKLLVLRYYYDLPLKEMARELNIRAEAVRSRIRRALSKLKPELEAQGIDDADRPVRVLQSTFR